MPSQIPHKTTKGPTLPQDKARFRQNLDIFLTEQRPQHRDGECDETSFDLLLAMQRDHFWYSGRHRLLLKILQRERAG